MTVIHCDNECVGGEKRAPERRDAFKLTTAPWAVTLANLKTRCARAAARRATQRERLPVAAGFGGLSDDLRVVGAGEGDVAVVRLNPQLEPADGEISGGRDGYRAAGVPDVSPAHDDTCSLRRVDADGASVRPLEGSCTCRVGQRTAGGACVLRPVN